MTAQGAAPSAYWDEWQWGGIVQLAHLERRQREVAADARYTPAERAAALKAANRCARNVRAWAHIADLKTPILR